MFKLSSPVVCPRDPGSQRWSLTLLFLDVPTFTTSRLPRDPSSQRWNYVGEKWPMNFAWNARLPRSIQDLLHAVNLRHGTDVFTSPPKEGVLRIFSPWKIRRFRPGLNPRTWVPKASTLPLDHRSRNLNSKCTCGVWIYVSRCFHNFITAQLTAISCLDVFVQLTKGLQNTTVLHTW